MKQTNHCWMLATSLMLRAWCVRMPRVSSVAQGGEDKTREWSERLADKESRLSKVKIDIQNKINFDFRKSSLISKTW